MSSIASIPGKAKRCIFRILAHEPVLDHEMKSNGEHWFLESIANHGLVKNEQYIVDVGAHCGDWSAAAFEYCKGDPRRYIGIEPIPEFAALARNRLSTIQIDVVETLLTDNDKCGEMTIYNVNGGGRMYDEIRNDLKTTAHTVQSITGDQLVSHRKLNPGLMKIDCDGHDLHVLKGFGQTLTSNKPLIQFEYSQFWRHAKATLRDAVRYFEEKDYSVFQLWPTHLRPLKLSLFSETGRNQNLVAVHNEMVIPDAMFKD